MGRQLAQLAPCFGSGMSFPPGHSTLPFDCVPDSRWMEFGEVEIPCKKNIKKKRQKLHKQNRFTLLCYSSIFITSFSALAAEPWQFWGHSSEFARLSPSKRILKLVPSFLSILAISHFAHVGLGRAIKEHHLWTTWVRVHSWGQVLIFQLLMVKGLLRLFMCHDLLSAAVWGSHIRTISSSCATWTMLYRSSKGFLALAPVILTTFWRDSCWPHSLPLNHALIWLQRFLFQEDVENAAKLANAHEFIEGLPEGPLGSPIPIEIWNLPVGHSNGLHDLYGNI